MLSSDSRDALRLSTDNEKLWLSKGSPAYRISPALQAALLKTSLDLPCSAIRLPHREFSIELGTPIGIEINSERRFVTAAMFVSTVCIDLESALLVVTQDSRGRRHTAVVSLHKDDPVSNWIVDKRLLPGPNRLDRRSLKTCLSIAIGASLFAVAANGRYVKPVRTNTRKRRKQGKPTQRKWTLGADIRLPGCQAHRGLSITHQTQGGALTFAHLRQGHLRMTALGPAHDRRYELRFVSPTIVRPDLPMTPKATRHYADKG